MNALSRLLFNLNAMLMLGLWCALLVCCRPALDDLALLQSFNELGTWATITEAWKQWLPRWSALAVLGQLLPEWANGNHTVWAIIIPTSFALSAFMLVRGLVTRFSLQVDFPDQATIAIYWVGALFLLTWPRHDTGLWLTALPMYVLNLAALAAALGLVLSPKVKGATGHIVLFALGLYAGGASEPMALSALVLCFYLLIDGQTTDLPTKLHALTLGLFIGFGLMLMAPGNWVRKAAQPNLGTWPLLVVGAKTYLKSILIELPLRLPLVAVLVAPFALLGRNNAGHQCHGLQGLIATQMSFLAMADGFLLVNAAAMAWALGTQGPDRVWMIIPLLALVFGVSVAFRWAEWIGQKLGSKTTLMVVIGQLGLASALLYLWATQVPIAVNYAKAYEARMTNIKNMVEQENVPSVIKLDPLPSSGWLMSAEITTDTAHFSNKQLSVYFGKKAVFVLK